MQFFRIDALKALPVLALLAAYAGAAFGVAGNVQFVIGDVKAINRAGATRVLQKGAPIDEGDRIVTGDGASAQIKMVDGGFIAVRPNTDMGFDTYHYAGKEDGTENAAISLLRGGFRTITGVIGRTNKQNYLVKTVTATIGIRGTDHEPMVILPPLPGQAAIAAPGTYDKVNVGIAFIRTDVGSVDIHRNQVGFAPDTRTLPLVLPKIPPFYKPTPAPGPQKAKDEQKDEGKKDSQQSAAAPAPAAAEKAAEAPAQIRETAVVDPTSTVTAAPAPVAAAAAPVAVAPVVEITATDASGTTVNTTTQTLTSSTGAEVPLSQGAFALEAQTAADAALASASALNALLTTAGSTAASTPALSAVSAAQPAVSSASTAAASIAALSIDSALAASNATAAAALASTAAGQVSTATSKFNANGSFADPVIAVPAFAALNAANAALQTASGSVQTAAGTASAQNSTLTSAQSSASAALAAANQAMSAANSALAALTAAGIPISSNASALLTEAQTAASAAQAAAAQAQTLQNAGDFSGAQAQLAIAQQQAQVAANALASAPQIIAAVANADAALLAATSITAASTGLMSAATSAQSTGSSAVSTTSTQLAAAQTQAPTVQQNAVLAQYNNPAVVTTNRFVGVMDTVVPITGGFVDGYGPGAGFSGVGQANTSFVLDGAGNLVEGRHMWYEETPASSSAPQLLVADANIKRTAGTSVETFKLPDNSIYGGRWQGGTITVTDNAVTNPVATFSRNLGLTSEHWAIMLAPTTGYVQALTGTTAYTKAAATSPTDALGNVGVLNTASLTANFTDQLVSAGVNLTIAGKTLDVAATNMPIHGSNFSTGTGVTAACTGCASTYFANVGGGFAGDAAASAGLNYMLWTGTAPGATSPAADLIHGLAAFSTATAPTVSTGGPFAAYAPTYTAVEVATQFFGSIFGSGSLVAPADLTYVGGGLSSFTERDIGGGGSNSFSVIGGSTPVTANATSFATTSVQFGRWSSATGLQASYTTPLGAQWGPSTTWIYGPQGYLDTPVVLGVNTGPLTGTFIYALDGSTAPYDRQSGTNGTLNSASVSANFTNQTASASLALTVGGQAWSANTPTPVNFGYSNTFYASSYPGGTVNNLTVSMGAGTPVACPTCFGNLSGAFTGQNYAGAILSYNLWDNGNAGGEIVGHAALARTGVVSNGTPAATGKYFVADWGGGIQYVDTLGTTGGVLTSYGWGSPALPANGFASTTVSCTTCTVTAATNATTAAAPTGVYFGTWDAGSFTNTWGGPTGTASPHWITGPEAGPLFLPNALTGTKTFAFDGGMVTNSAGVAGTVLGTTALAVDFTKQIVGINLDLSINDTAATPTIHAWNAKTLPGNEAVLNSGKGLGGAAFNASSFNDVSGGSGGSGFGLLTVTVDGTTPANGNVSGQLTGTGLNGAIISYDLNAVIGGVATQTFEQVNGVAAFLGSTSDVATPHRSVMISATDPTSIINQPVLGFNVNNPTRMLTDVAGNLTQFDMSQINDHGNGNNNSSKTLSSGTSVLTDRGSDPVTGISWGRWAGGSINITNRIDGTSKTQPLAGSLHWIAGPAETAAVTLPLSGTFTYVNAGGTAPTDNLGNVGTLNSATLVANFTAQTVNVGVQTTIAGASLGGSASAVPIIQRTAFAAGPDMPVNLSVSCTGACGTTHRGTIVGGFGGAGATGATMMYSLEKVGGANASITSGVVGFHR